MSTQPAYRRTAAERTAAILAPRKGFAYAGNQIIRPAKLDKPHVVFIHGLWRVSPQPRKADHHLQRRWAAAHAWAAVRNEVLLETGR